MSPVYWPPSPTRSSISCSLKLDRPHVLPVTQPNRLDDQVGDHRLADRVRMDPVVDEHVQRIDSGRIDEFDAPDRDRVHRCRVGAQEVLGRLEAVDQRHVVLLGQAGAIAY